MPIRLKRAYEAPEPGDGERYLVERLWPRGVKKEGLALTAWLKDIAPSTELRTWYGHQAERQPEFAHRYRVEMALPEKRAALQELVQRARAGTVTLVFATREIELSGAVVLKGILEDMASGA